MQDDLGRVGRVHLYALEELLQLVAQLGRALARGDVDGHAAQRLAHLVLGDVRQRAVRRGLALERRELAGGRLAVLFLFGNHAQQRRGHVGAGGQVGQLADLSLEALRLPADLGHALAVRLGDQARLHALEQRAREHVAGEILRERVDHGAIDAAREHAAALAVAVEGGVDAVPGRAGGRAEQAGEQVVVLLRVGARALAQRQLVQDLLRLVLGDQRLVRAGLLLPLAGGAIAGAVRALLLVLVPDRAAGVGHGVALDAQQRRAGKLEAALARRLHARDPGRAIAQEGLHLRRELAQHQARLQHRRALADRTRGRVLEAVAERRAAASAEAAAHVLAHAGEALALADQAVPLVDAVEDGLHDRALGLLHVGQVLVDHRDAARAALAVLEPVGRGRAPGDARRVL